MAASSQDKRFRDWSPNPGSCQPAHPRGYRNVHPGTGHGRAMPAEMTESGDPGWI